MRFELCILGAGAAAPNDRFATTSQALNIHEDWMLIDAGEGVQSRLRAMGVPWNRVSKVFISHLHGDHFLGLPGLLGSMNLLGRTKPLMLFGPPELEILVREIHRLTHTYLRFPLHFFHLSGDKEFELVFESSRYEVFAFPTKHRVPTWGFRFEEKRMPLRIRKERVAAMKLERSQLLALKSGQTIQLNSGEILTPEACCYPPHQRRAYVYSSDTSFSDSVVRAARGAQILYHEATFAAEHRDRARSTGHSTAEDAARVAREAEVHQLILGHFSNRYRDLTRLRSEAEAIFSRVSLASDGSRWILPLEAREQEKPN